MKYRVEFTDQANADAHESYLWIAQDSPGNAIRWFEGLIEHVHSLDIFPLRCALAPESEDFGEEIRQLLYGVYRIIFKVVGDTVYVLHVRHGARDRLTPESE